MAPPRTSERLWDVGLFLLGFWARVLALRPWPEVGQWTSGEMRRLGPVFIKLGQVLSTRRLPPFPDAFYAELVSLQSRVPASPLPEDRARALEERLRRRFPGLELQRTPFKAASVAQVHLVRHRGRPWVLKVLRPGVSDEVQRDFQLLERLPLGALWREAVDALGAALQQELDLRNEARLQADILAAVPDFRCARPLWATEDFLLMTYLPGASPYDVPGDAERAQRVLDSFLSLVLSGRFHSDPHAGNLAFRGDEVVWYDIGAVLPLPPRFPVLLQDTALALQDRDVDAIYESLVLYGALEPSKAGRRAFRTLWAAVMDARADVRRLEAAVRALQFDPAYLALGRALFTVQGVCLQLDPAWSLEAGLRSYLQRSPPQVSVRERAELAARNWDRLAGRLLFLQRYLEL